jgi:hypothetical protein
VPTTTPAAAVVTVQVEPRVHVWPFTVVELLARELLGIELAVTVKDGVLDPFVTVGTSQEGQLAEGAENDVTVPLPTVIVQVLPNVQVCPLTVVDALEAAAPMVL